MDNNGWDEDVWCEGGGTDADVPAAFRGALNGPAQGVGRGMSAVHTFCSSFKQ